jgi:hypothetical protein
MIIFEILIISLFSMSEIIFKKIDIYPGNKIKKVKGMSNNPRNPGLQVNLQNKIKYKA